MEKIKLKLHDDRTTFKKRETKVKSSWCLDCNVNKARRSGSLTASLKEKSHPIANAEIKVFFKVGHTTKSLKTNYQVKKNLTLTVLLNAWLITRVLNFAIGKKYILWLFGFAIWWLRNISMVFNFAIPIKIGSKI